jgi:hypothetical protein
VDPLVIIIAIILYVPSAIAMTPVIFGIFISKIILIFLETFTQFWKNISLMAAAGWYIRVLLGTHESPTNQGNTGLVISFHTLRS